MQKMNSSPIPSLQKREAYEIIRLNFYMLSRLITLCRFIDNNSLSFEERDVSIMYKFSYRHIDIILEVCP